VADQRDTAVDGDDQPETHDAQVGALLLGMATLRDRCPVVGGVDVGGEVGHVQHQTRHLDGELGDHAGDDAPLDLGQLLFGDGVPGIPEPPMVQSGSGDLQETITGCAVPALGEPALRTRVGHPICHRQRDIAAHRRRRIGPARPHDLVDDLGHLHPLQHRPHRGHVTEGKVAGAVRHRLRTVDGRLDVGRLAQVPLGDDLRLPADPGDLPQVVVGLPLDGLTHNRCRI